MGFVFGHSAFFRVIRKVGVTRFAARRRKPHAGGVCSPFPTTWVRPKWVRFLFGGWEKSAKTSVFIGECSFSKMGSFGNFSERGARNLERGTDAPPRIGWNGLESNEDGVLSPRSTVRGLRSIHLLSHGAIKSQNTYAEKLTVMF